MRKTKKDWMEVGLRVLSEYGINGVTIERMTGVLGVTKGSFYHHFRHVKDFEAQLIAYWADQYLATSSSIPEAPDKLLDLLDVIMEEGFGPITAPEAAIRFWANQDEDVRLVVEKVDSHRHAFLLQVFHQLTGDEEKAGMMADMLFTIMIGSITAQPRISTTRVMEMYRTFKQLYHLGGV